MIQSYLSFNYEFLLTFDNRCQRTDVLVDDLGSLLLFLIYCKIHWWKLWRSKHFEEPWNPKSLKIIISLYAAWKSVSHYWKRCTTWIVRKYWRNFVKSNRMLPRNDLNFFYSSTPKRSGTDLTNQWFHKDK